MRSLLLVVLLLLSSRICIGISQASALAEYYSFVHRADCAITEADYEGAARYYDSAFALLEKPFSLDLYNASICAALNKDYQKLQTLSKALIEKGADTGFFRKAIYRPFIASQQWKEVQAEYPSIVSKRTIYTALVSHIKAFVTRDQAVHCMLPKNTADEVFIEKMHRQDDSLAESLHGLMVQHDYLSEEVIGANFRDTTLSSAPLYGVLVIHEFEKDGKTLRKVIDSAIRLGKLYAEIGLRWVEFSERGRMKFLGDFFIYRDTLRSNWVFTDTASRDYKLNEKRSARLLSETPSAEVLELRDYYYMDEPASINKRLSFQLWNMIGKKYPLFLYSLSTTQPVFANSEDEKRASQWIRNTRVIATVQ